MTKGIPQKSVSVRAHRIADFNGTGPSTVAVIELDKPGCVSSVALPRAQSGAMLGLWRPDAARQNLEWRSLSWLFPLPAPSRTESTLLPFVLVLGTSVPLTLLRSPSRPCSKDVNIIDAEFVVDFGAALHEVEGLAHRGEIVAVVITSLKKLGFCHGADVETVVRFFLLFQCLIRAPATEHPLLVRLRLCVRVLDIVFRPFMDVRSSTPTW